MTTYYRGAKVKSTPSTKSGPFSGVYRGVKFTQSETEETKVPSIRRGTYRGVDWVA